MQTAISKNVLGIPLKNLRSKRRVSNSKEDSILQLVGWALPFPFLQLECCISRFKRYTYLGNHFISFPRIASSSKSQLGTGKLGDSTSSMGRGSSMIKSVRDKAPSNIRKITDTISRLLEQNLDNL